MFRTVSLSIIRSLALYTQQYIQVMLTACYADCLLASSQHNLYDIYLLLCVQCQTPHDGQRYCPKNVEFYSKNKCENLVFLVGFIIRIYHDARSSECPTHLLTFRLMQLNQVSPIRFKTCRNFIVLIYYERTNDKSCETCQVIIVQKPKCNEK